MEERAAAEDDEEEEEPGAPAEDDEEEEEPGAAMLAPLKGLTAFIICPVCFAVGLFLVAGVEAEASWGTSATTGASRTAGAAAAAASADVFLVFFDGGSSSSSSSDVSSALFLPFGDCPVRGFLLLTVPASTRWSYPRRA